VEIGRLILLSLQVNAIAQGARMREPFDKPGITSAPMKREDSVDSRKSGSPAPRRSSCLSILSYFDARSIAMEGL
jgi:hypothetical protein